MLVVEVVVVVVELDELEPEPEPPEPVASWANTIAWVNNKTTVAINGLYQFLIFSISLFF
jgi:hypothetical protein